MAMVMALGPSLLPAASAGSEGGFVYGTIRDEFGKTGIRCTIVYLALSVWVVKLKI